jgi:hypothetical protein
MRYQLANHGWPIGATLIPTGTIIDSNGTDEWSRLAAGRVPPLNAEPQDQEAYDLMVLHHSSECHRIMTRDPAINRHADPKPKEK